MIRAKQKKRRALDFLLKLAGGTIYGPYAPGYYEWVLAGEDALRLLRHMSMWLEDKYPQAQILLKLFSRIPLPRRGRKRPAAERRALDVAYQKLALLKR